MRPCAWLGALALVAAITAACGGVLNPPLPPPTPTPFVPSTPRPRPATATPAPEAWVKNFRVTQMWSGPEGAPGVISFGETSSEFCSFRIDRVQDNPRLYVYNPHTESHFWIDGVDVGPVDQPPPRRSGPKPNDVNCTEAIYDGRPVAPIATPATPATGGGPAPLTGTPAASQTPTPTPVLRP